MLCIVMVMMMCMHPVSAIDHACSPSSAFIACLFITFADICGSMFMKGAMRAVRAAQQPLTQAPRRTRLPPLHAQDDILMNVVSFIPTVYVSAQHPCTL
jgi:hypothetical protein